MIIFLASLSIILFVFLVYWRTIYNYYVVDDFSVYKMGGDRPKSWLKRFYDNLRCRIYHDDDPKKPGLNRIAHLQTIAIHSLVCVMIFLSFGKVFNNYIVSYLAALLFAFNPNNHEVSIWLSGKAYGYTSAYVLFAWMFPLFAPFVYFFAFLPSFYFNAIFSPLMFLILPGWWKLLALLFIYIFAIKAKWIFNPKRNTKLAAYVDKDTDDIQNEAAVCFNPKNIIRAIKFYGYYFTNGILANNLAFYQSYMSEYVTDKKGIEESNKPDRYFWVGVVVLYILITNLISNYNPAVFGLLWFTINIAPVCNFINLGQQHITSRYAYLPNIGLAFMLANMFIGYTELSLRFIAGLLLAGGLIGWYLRALKYSMLAYLNDFWHNHFEITFEPKYSYSWLLHGNMFFARGQFNTALQDYFEASLQYKDNFKVLFNISSTYIALGRIKDAIAYVEKARACDLIGQEKLKDDWLKEREELIGKIIQAQQQKIKINLKISDIPIVI